MLDSSDNGNVCKHSKEKKNHIMLSQAGNSNTETPRSQAGTHSNGFLSLLSQLTAGKKRLKLSFSAFLHGEIRMVIRRLIDKSIDNVYQNPN